MSQKPTIKRQSVQLTAAGGKINRVKPGEQAPDINSMFRDDLPNPIAGVEPSDDLQTMATAETSAMLDAIVAAKKERRDNYRTSTDPNYYFVVCFQNTEQCAQFLEAAGWDKPGVRYLDGLALARKLGIDIQPINLPRTPTKPAPKALRGRPVIE